MSGGEGAGLSVETLPKRRELTPPRFAFRCAACYPTLPF
jgi:hypothetical protein